MKFKEIKKYITDGNWECDFTMIGLIDFIENKLAETYGKFEICPDFQRGRIWTQEQQIRYIEHLFKGGKTAKVIYVNIYNWVKFKNTLKGGVLVDGLQRYTAIKRFLNNEIKVFDLFLDEYEDKEIILRTFFIKLNINSLETRKEVLEWYLQINNGGTPHTKEEIEKVEKLLELEKENKN